MKYLKRYNYKNFFLFLAILSYIYFTCCPLQFNKHIYTIIINQIPFCLLLIIDFYILIKVRNRLSIILKFYISKNKVLFTSIFLFICYDIITLLYAKNPSYSIMKYLIFFKTVFLIGSIFLCLYDDNINEFKKNTEFIIKSLNVIMLFVIITTISKWCLGFSPYLKKISLITDYNIYASYLLFTLIFTLYFSLEKWNHFTLTQRITYFLCIALAFDLLYLSGSRRSVVLCPIVIGIFIVIYMLKEKSRKGSFKKLAYFFILVLLLITNITVSIQAFEKYVYHLEIKNKTEKHETGLTARYETINIEEGFASRDMIWKVAISDISTFSNSELLFGKGNGYGWTVYENSKDKNVQELVASYAGTTKISEKWMHPHNIILKELLDGGLLKIALLLNIAIVLLYYIIKFIQKNLVYGGMFLSLFLCFAAEFMLNGTYGLLGEELFWLGIAIFIMIKNSENYELFRAEI